jgi:hypothetical protein
VSFPSRNEPRGRRTPATPGATSSRTTCSPTCARDPANQWLVLEPNRIEKQYWKDLWRYRELFAILAWRDISSCGNSRATSKP